MKSKQNNGSLADELERSGLTLCGQNNFVDGIANLEKACNMQPKNHVFLVNLGQAYIFSRDYTKALRCLQKITRLKPDYDESWYKLGVVFSRLDNTEEAINAYSKAILLNPNHYEAFYNLGNCALSFGNYQTAIRHYKKCLSVNPNYPPAHNNLGIAMLEWDCITEAERHYLRAIELQFNYPEAIDGLVKLYSKSGQENELSKWKKRLIKANPENHSLFFGLMSEAPVIAMSNVDIDVYRKYIFALIDRFSSVYAEHFSSVETMVKNSCHPSYGLVYQGRPNKAIKEKYAHLFRNIPKCVISHCNEKTHVGFVVTNGHEGVFLKCMRGILNHIDTVKFKVSVVCSLPNGEKIIAPTLTNKAIGFVNLPINFTEAQNLLVESKFDILYYWEIGTDSINYFLALTKPAKIQATSWGWPSTSGLDSVDYFISEKDLEPNDAQAQYYTERLVLFDQLPLYYYRPNVPTNPKSLSEYGIPEVKCVYFCQQNLRKVHPDFDFIIKKLIERDTDCCVLFIKDKYRAITEKLQARMSSVIGDNFSKVLFLERMPETDYLGLLSRCSVVLDTIFYGGGANTIFDAIQAGVAVVTIEGTQHSGRFASATFKQMGIPSLITQNAEDYIELAHTICIDHTIRKNYTDQIKQNSSTIFETYGAVKELEDFFVNIMNACLQI